MNHRINSTLKLLLLCLGTLITTALLLLFGQLLRTQLHGHEDPAPALQHDSTLRHKEFTHESPGKPGAAVRFIGPSVTTMDVHEQQQLLLTLAVDTPQSVQVSVQTDDGLTLLSARTRWEFSNAFGEIEVPLEIYAETDGNHFVHLFITTTDPDGRQAARAMAMQVRVGTQVMASMQVQMQHKQATEAAYVSLPAVETLR